MPQGTPEHVPDDGLTTRQRRNRPLVIVHTGPGKGKSTAAFGLALRAWNQGWPVGVFQFVKSAKWRVGEERALRVLGETGMVRLGLANKLAIRLGAVAVRLDELAAGRLAGVVRAAAPRGRRAA